MSNPVLNKEYADNLNRKAQQLNAERQKMIGKRESASLAFSKAVKAYSLKYGVTLDDTNLSEEYQSVSETRTKELEDLAKQINIIESGEYRNNTSSEGVAVQNDLPSTGFNQEVVTQPVQQELDNTQQQVQQQQTFEQPVHQPAFPTPPVQQQQTFQQPNQPQTNFQQPVQQQQQTSQQPVNQQQNFGQQQTIFDTPAQPVQQQQQFGQQNNQQQTFEQPNQQPFNAPNPTFGQPAFPVPPVNNNVIPEAPQQLGVAQNEDVSEQAFAPAGWGEKPKDANDTFKSIAGNEAGFNFK